MRTLSSLKAKLVVSHAIVGLSVALVALGTTLLQHRQADEVEQTSQLTSEAALALSSEVDAATEEGFAYLLGGDPEDRVGFVRRLAVLREGSRSLQQRADIRPAEAESIAVLQDRIDDADTASKEIFGLYESNGSVAGHFDRYDRAMDHLRESFDRVTNLVHQRARHDDVLAHQRANRAAIASGFVALVIAAALGLALGSRLVAPLSRLRDATVAFGRGHFAPIVIDANDGEIADVASAFQSMSTNVRRLMAALEQKNDDNRLLLDNVQQGLMTVERSGHVTAEHSARLEAWFGAPSPNALFWDYLTSVDTGFAAMLEVAWDQLSLGAMPLDVSLAQLPARLAVDDKHYAFEYHPIGTSEEPERYLVVVSDVTAGIESAVAERSKKETLALFEHMLADRSGFVHFVEEATQLVSAIASAGPDDVPALKRALHTLKGNCALFGLESVASVAHDLETFVSDEGTAPGPAEIERLVACWAPVSAKSSQFVGSFLRIVEVPLEEHLALERLVQRRAPYDIIASALRDTRLEPTLRRLHQLGEQAAHIALRLGKPRPIVKVSDGGLRVDAGSWANFWSSFVHPLRNAIDHGIEPPKERAARGKPVAGTVFLRTRIDRDRFVVEIEDDGRGLDWEAIRRRCAERGAPCETQADLERGLFLEGLSTAEVTTEISGRGVGMGALLVATERMGGEVRVTSREGLGTLVALRFPIGSMSRSTSIVEGRLTLPPAETLASRQDRN